MNSTNLSVATQASLTALPALGTKINREHRACEKAVGRGLQHALKAGLLLSEMKTRLPHGEWGGWLEDHFKGSARTARVYLQIAKRWPELQAKRQTSATLGIDGALKLLAAPREASQGPFDLPELVPDRIFRAVGNHNDLMEIHPSPDYPDHYFLAHYIDLDTDNASVIYDRRPGRYTEKLLAHLFRAVCKFAPVTDWYSEPSTGERPWFVTAFDRPCPACGAAAGLSCVNDEGGSDGEDSKQ